MEGEWLSPTAVLNGLETQGHGSWGSGPPAALGIRKASPAAARCSRGPSVIGRPAGGRGRGLAPPCPPAPPPGLCAFQAACRRQRAGGRTGSGQARPAGAPSGAKQPCRQLGRSDAWFREQSRHPGSSSQNTARGGPRSGADRAPGPHALGRRSAAGHRGLDSSARPPRFRQPRCDLGSLLALWPPRGSRTATATSSASPGAGSGRRSVRSSLLPAAPSEGGQRVSAPSCSLTRHGAELRGARHATVPASVGPGTSGHEPRPAGPS